MADALVSEASVARHEGSTPSLRTFLLSLVVGFLLDIYIVIKTHPAA